MRLYCGPNKITVNYFYLKELFTIATQLLRDAAFLLRLVQMWPSRLDASLAQWEEEEAFF